MTSPQNPEEELQLDLQQAASGGIFPLRVSTPVPCQNCSATVHPGRKSTVCPCCKGQLSLPMESASVSPDGRGASGFCGECTICQGAGWTIEDECDECHGSGLTTATRTIRVRIPAGAKDGQRMRLPRQGFASGRPGTPAGDLYVTVKVGCSRGSANPGFGVALGSEGVRDVEAIRSLWSAVRAKVRQLSRTIDVMLVGATVHSVENSTLILRHNSDPLAKRLNEQRNAGIIRDALNDVLGGDWQLLCELSTGEATSTQSRDAKTAKLDKVAKLLRKAESVAGTPEEAVYLDRAFALMAKYGLEEALVRATLDDGTNPHQTDTGTPQIVERIFNVTSKYGSHQILTCLATALHCRGVHWKSERTGCPTDSVRVSLFGLPDHIERVHFLWDLLQPQALRALELLPEDASWYSPQSVYRRSWVVGFAIGIASRLREHEQRAVGETESGTAVMLFNLYKSDEEQAEAAIRERWPNLEAEEPCESFDPLGIAAGQRAAWSAALDRSDSANSGTLKCA